MLHHLPITPSKRTSLNVYEADIFNCFRQARSLEAEGGGRLRFGGQGAGREFGCARSSSRIRTIKRGSEIAATSSPHQEPSAIGIAKINGSAPAYIGWRT